MNKAKSLESLESEGKRVRSRRDVTGASEVRCPANHIERFTSLFLDEEPRITDSELRSHVFQTLTHKRSLPFSSTSSHYSNNMLERSCFEYQTLTRKVSCASQGHRFVARALKVLL